MRRAPSEAPTIPGLEFRRLLGTGGFSDVFLYEQQLPRRRVAVKVLLTDSLNTAAREAFVDEANVMAQLSAHPYIVTIFHADVAADDRPYFVMEYCSGPSLSELYKKETFSVADALRTGVRLSGAIATAHAAGILHRDIKPANVLTNDFGWPALTDFGISSAVDELPMQALGDAGQLQDSGGSTASQSVGMSVPWSPPEMFEDVPRPDVRSDVFSLAATIHTLLAGRTPFEIPGRSNGTLDLVGRIERGVITPIGRDEVPRSLSAVLQKGMATRRDERYASAIEFARALQRIELELGYSPTSIEVPNLVVRDRDDHADAGGEDETRVRSVSTIAAQPPRDPAPGTPAPGTPAPGSPAPGSEDETRARSFTVIGEPPASSPASLAEEGTIVRSAMTAPATPWSAGAADGDVDNDTVVRPRRQRTSVEGVHAAPAQPTDPAVPGAVASTDRAIDGASGRSRRRLGIVAGLVAAVVAAGVITSLVVAGGSVREESRPSAEATNGGGSAIVGGAVPTPTIVSAVASVDDESVTFTWSNPEPEDGDRYTWALAEQPGKLTPTTEPTVTVARPSAGARVCVTVYVLRAGRTSGVPLESCNPE
ncbi:serine/threonine protein kinase [Glaciihabitans tibetensis]|uniref:non-specific serine/threonine protein kinase n=1 Tax=Glaciihabitans tibetensis TaxID=1266600 RepID=A0A2T0VGK6_9MICO|nr:serine/threonine-protein kinase [Glaciihabitans tibetensis]PRY69194.1 serine/threonine protein kinase [Glaciihabitans tibetensis]